MSNEWNLDFHAPLITHHSLLITHYSLITRAVPRRGIEPRLAVSKTAVLSGTLAGLRSPSRQQNPDLESNQDLDLRRVQCVPLHHRDGFSKRADGWIRTSMRRFTGPLPF